MTSEADLEHEVNVENALKYFAEVKRGLDVNKSRKLSTHGASPRLYFY
jgi:hypothetical protein